MILTRTPLRVSLFGGGSDLPAFCDHHPGHVLTGAIDKYIYVALKKRFDGLTRACYSQMELVNDPANLAHDIIRTVFLRAKVRGVDVVSFSDVPHHGTGLGTSSAFTVGLVNSVYAMRNVHPEQYELAAEACKIEIKYCHKPIGRQDQYATALGGLRELTFKPGNDLVGTYLVPQQGDVPRLLRNQMLLFDTGIGRDGDAILAAECQSIGDHTATLLAMAQMARDAGEILGRGRIDELGPMLDEAWQMKKSLAVGISNPQIDAWYAAGKAAGATGGKVLGAGGGGFMLFLASPNRHEQIVAALPELHHVAFDWDYTGTTVVFSDIPG